MKNNVYSLQSALMFKYTNISIQSKLWKTHEANEKKVDNKHLTPIKRNEKKSIEGGKFTLVDIMTY